jgi:hypothetical protein
VIVKIRFADDMPGMAQVLLWVKPGSAGRILYVRRDTPRGMVRTALREGKIRPAQRELAVMAFTVRRPRAGKAVRFSGVALLAVVAVGGIGIRPASQPELNHWHPSRTVQSASESILARLDASSGKETRVGRKTRLRPSLARLGPTVRKRVASCGALPAFLRPPGAGTPHGTHRRLSAR